MQRLTGHDATSVAAIPPTLLSVVYLGNEEEVLSVHLYMLCLSEHTVALNCNN